MSENQWEKLDLKDCPKWISKVDFRHKYRDKSGYCYLKGRHFEYKVGIGFGSSNGHEYTVISSIARRLKRKQRELVKMPKKTLPALVKERAMSFRERRK